MAAREVELRVAEPRGVAGDHERLRSHVEQSGARRGGMPTGLEQQDVGAGLGQAAGHHAPGRACAHHRDIGTGHPGGHFSSGRSAPIERASQAERHTPIP